MIVFLASLFSSICTREIDKLKSRLANDLKGIASTKLHVENEKERLLKNAHIIAEVKAKQAEEAMAKAEQDKHGEKHSLFTIAAQNDIMLCILLYMI